MKNSAKQSANRSSTTPARSKPKQSRPEESIPANTATATVRGFYESVPGGISALQPVGRHVLQISTQTHMHLRAISEAVGSPMSIIAEFLITRVSLEQATAEIKATTLRKRGGGRAKKDFFSG